MAELMVSLSLAVSVCGMLDQLFFGAPQFVILI